MDLIPSGMVDPVEGSTRYYDTPVVLSDDISKENLPAEMAAAVDSFPTEE